MAITYTYTITKLWASPEEVNGFSDVVLNIFFDITATNTETSKSGVFSGVWNIDPPEPNDPNFVQFTSLTQNEVLAWLQTSLGPERRANMEQNAANNIFSQPSLPW